MKRIVIPAILLFAPFALLAQVNDKEPLAPVSIKPVQPFIAPNTSNVFGGNTSVLPKNFPAINKGTIFNGTVAPEPITMPNITGPVYNMPILVPDMSNNTPMPVVSGLQNNKLPEPMPGASIYRKKKK